MSKINEMFSGVFKLDEKEKTKLLKDSIIVLDTNILLDIFRYNMDTAIEFVNALTNYKENLWMPYQVGVEFFKNKDGVSMMYSKTLQDFKKKSVANFKSLNEDIKKALKIISELSDIQDIIGEFEKKINDSLSKINEKYESEFNSNISEKEKLVYELYGDNIMDNFEKEEYENIIKEGHIRMINNIPPGYKDNKKEEYYKEYKINGDYIIFYSMIKLAKTLNKNVIFISEDVKQDWLEEKKDVLRYELRLEFYQETKKSIIYLSKEEFIKLHNKMQKAKEDKISKDAKNEITKKEDISNDTFNGISNSLANLNNLTSRLKEIDLSGLERINDIIIKMNDLSWIDKLNDLTKFQNNEFLEKLDVINKNFQQIKFDNENINNEEA